MNAPSTAITRRLLLAALGSSVCAPLAGATRPLKVGFIYPGPVGDAGWTFAHDAARRAVEDRFGSQVVVTAVPDVREGADAERVLRDLVAQGNGLIFATSFGYMEAVLRVAADHPEVKFEHATGFRTAANVRTYDTRSYEPAYLAGVVAGGTTRSGLLGVVGALPAPAVLNGINAFTLGAQAMNAATRVRVVWVNAWFDPPRETEAAISLLNQGADVLMLTTDSPAALQTAERLGRRGFGLSSDMGRFAPKAHLGSIVNNWAPYCIRAVGDALDDRWVTGHSWWGMKEGAVELVGVPSDVPPAVHARVAAVRGGLRDGSFAIWRGPLQDNIGQEVLPRGQVADDAFLRQMNFYVKSVEGRVPG
ncbi:BMP family ABC transporter substrate-binding protein [Hydrogenophaga sp.]|uniref:BMP family ABC transporter substrate-binding protein n=1 Tax=Hydrogenophaga sp. TaxID=1904254 RepID=UPI0025BF7024|nr:BMP family ABC transporter substrate-binding protein [Hydrogenophaga sp.]MBT9466307.1 BMP family ABC transporter substrate-binding protein [Hydrogenophaga sp.]